MSMLKPLTEIPNRFARKRKALLEKQLMPHFPFSGCPVRKHRAIHTTSVVPSLAPPLPPTHITPGNTKDLD